jgi:hemolysin activation/secretion protein
MNFFTKPCVLPGHACDLRRKGPVEVLLLLSLAGLLMVPVGAWAQPSDPETASRARNMDNQPPGVAAKAIEPQTQMSAKQTEQRFYVQEYRVQGGGHLLPQIEVEKAVYPYLGPYRTPDDVEQARAALEDAYRSKGFQTVSVQIPPQQVKGGVIVLQVVKGEVARLRVNGSRYFSIDEIKKEAPSLQEGSVPNFNNVSKDIVTLNQFPDRRVTPSLRAGETPGTVDVDLNVKDSMPLHGSLEINNRYSANTTPLRINGSVNYDNLWQLGHSIGASFQVAPEDSSEVEVFSGYYLAHMPDMNWLSLMLQGTKQDSNVSTLGGIGVAGRGQTVGLRAIISLPQQKDFYHSVSLGFDYKHFDQNVQIAGSDSTTPITYFPLSAAYSGTWMGKGYETDLNSSVNLHLRGVGSSEAEFDENRHGADGSFIYFRGDLSHTRDLAEGSQIFGKVQGQAADQPLVNSEQFSGGGLGSVRGYIESEELGDNALLGTVEMRSPSLTGVLGKTVNDWRFYVFGDGGILTINDPLLEQQARFTMASVGAGTRLKLQDHYNGSLDLGVPLLPGTQTQRYALMLTFRVWAEF